MRKYHFHFSLSVHWLIDMELSAGQIPQKPHVFTITPCLSTPVGTT